MAKPKKGCVKKAKTKKFRFCAQSVEDARSFAFLLMDLGYLPALKVLGMKDMCTGKIPSFIRDEKFWSDYHDPSRLRMTEGDFDELFQTGKIELC